MSTDTTLHDRLARAADDTGRPLRTDVTELLGRARAHRRRRRRRTVAAAALATGAVVVGVGLLPPLVGVGPEDPGRSPSPTTPAAPADRPVLDHAEVVRRCLPQLDKYGDLPMYPTRPTRRPWQVMNADLDYRAGDVVSLWDTGGMGNPVLCRIPEAGREEESVPFDALVARPDEVEEVAALCTEAYHGGDFGLDVRSSSPIPTMKRDSIPDLRGLRPAAVAGVDPLVIALFDHGGRDYRCLLGPVTWDVGVNDIRPEWPAPGGSIYLETIGTGSGAKSIVDEQATYVVGAGRTARRAASLEVTLPDGSVETAPVRNGVWAFAAKVDGFEGIVPLPTRVLGRDGSVLWAGDASAL